MFLRDPTELTGSFFVFRMLSSEDLARQVGQKFVFRAVDIHNPLISCPWNTISYWYENVWCDQVLVVPRGF